MLFFAFFVDTWKKQRYYKSEGFRIVASPSEEKEEEKKMKGKGKGSNRGRFLVLSLVVVVCCSQVAYSTVLTLSTHASDGISPPPAEQLDATFDFSVLDNTLTLTVTNLTPENPLSDPALKINEIYFNTDDNIQALVLNDVIGANEKQWDLTFITDGIHVNGFGLFDVSIIDGQGDLPHVIDSGETVQFVLGITGTGPFSDNNFIQLSTQIDSHVISYAAGKFYNGLPETSAYGATNVPEPASVCLLCLGALALLRKHRQ